MANLLLAALRTRWSSLASLAVVAAALLLSPVSRPAGWPCQFRALTGLPCLTCGLTRSVIRMAHLQPARALEMHPLGLLLFPLLLLHAVLGAAPRGARAAVEGVLRRYRRGVDRAAWMLLALLVCYGLGRIAWLLAAGRPSPW
jgi:hypothetical protein